MSESPKGNMTTREAGSKGGLTTKTRYGEEFYKKIGHKGGSKVRELINEAKKARGEA